MPLRIVVFCFIFAIGAVGVWVYRVWLGLLWREEPEFIQRYDLPRKPFDLGARPGAGFWAIVFRRYREVENIRVRQLGDLLFVLILAGSIGVITIVVVPESVWLG